MMKRRIFTNSFRILFVFLFILGTARAGFSACADQGFRQTELSINGLVQTIDAASAATQGSPAVGNYQDIWKTALDLNTIRSRTLGVWHPKLELSAPAKSVFHKLAGPSSLLALLTPEFGLLGSTTARLSPDQVVVLRRGLPSGIQSAKWESTVYVDKLFPALIDLGRGSLSERGIKDLHQLLKSPGLSPHYSGLREHLLGSLLKDVYQTGFLDESVDRALAAAADDLRVLLRGPTGVEGPSVWLVQKQAVLLTLLRIYDLYLLNLDHLLSQPGQFVRFLKTATNRVPLNQKDQVAGRILRQRDWMRVYRIKPGTPGQIALAFTTLQNAVHLADTYLDPLQFDQSVLSPKEILALSIAYAASFRRVDAIINHVLTPTQIPLSVRGSIEKKVIRYLEEVRSSGGSSQSLKLDGLTWTDLSEVTGFKLND